VAVVAAAVVEEGAGAAEEVSRTMQVIRKPIRLPGKAISVGAAVSLRS
jgi:hypothetical protein